MDPLLASASKLSFYVDLEYTAETTQSYDLNGKSIIGIIVPSTFTAGLDLNIVPNGYSLTTSNEPITLTPGEVQYVSNIPALRNADFILDGNGTGTLTLIIQ